MSWRNLIWISIVICLAALSLYLARRQPLHIDSRDPAIDQLAGAIHAYTVMRQRACGEFTADQAVRGAIEGMARRADPFGLYVPPQESAAFARLLEGELDQTGLLVARQEGKLVTLGALPGSPAAKAGLFGGLEILVVNGTASAYWPLGDVRGLLESASGVRLRLRMLDGQEQELALAAGHFTVASVAGLVRYDAARWLCALDEKNRIYYLRINQFSRHTPEDFKQLYPRGDNPRGLVLDLRDNPGGELDSAVAVARLFLTDGVIVRVVDRAGRETERHYAHDSGTFGSVPTAVLINARTASGAEILAGALQAHGRARLVGQTSFGKWCVQTPIKLGYGLGQLHLTTGEYFLPPRRGPQATQPGAPDNAGDDALATAPGKARGGLAPDRPAALTVSALEKLEILRLKALAAQASGPLPTTLPDRLNKAQRLREEILANDAQLAEALRLVLGELSPATRPASSSAGAGGDAEP